MYSNCASTGSIWIVFFYRFEFELSIRIKSIWQRCVSWLAKAAVGTFVITLVYVVAVSVEEFGEMDLRNENINPRLNTFLVFSLKSNEIWLLNVNTSIRSYHFFSAFKKFHTSSVRNWSEEFELTANFDKFELKYRLRLKIACLAKRVSPLNHVTKNWMINMIIA